MTSIRPEMMNKRQFLLRGLVTTSALTCTPWRVLTMETNDKLWKWSMEGLFWITTSRGPKCQICPNECLIKEGELGLCHNRTNVGGKIYSIAYGNPCAVNVDPIEKKPLNHFLPGSQAYSIATAGCNLACLNCQNWTISQTSPRDTHNYDLMPEAVVSEAQKSHCPVIAYTYSEPLSYYEYTLDTSRLARQKGIKNVLVTAGYIHDEPLRTLCKFIDAANVDLKSFSNERYLKLSSGTLNPVLNTLKTMKEQGVWLEITNLIVPEWTDDMAMIKQMCGWLAQNGLADTPLHFSRFHPEYKLTQLSATPIGTLTRAREIALSEGIKYVYIGNVPGLEAQNTTCPRCRTLLVERRGYTILQNNIVRGVCDKCGEKIPGIWE